MDYSHILCKDCSRVKVTKNLSQSIILSHNITQQEMGSNGCHKKLKNFIMSWDIRAIMLHSKQTVFYTQVHNAVTSVPNCLYARIHRLAMITIPHKCYAILVEYFSFLKINLTIALSLLMTSLNPTRTIIYSIISLLFLGSIKELPLISKL